MPPKALIVDDDPSVQKSLGRLLKLKGFAPIAASSVAEALAALNGAPHRSGTGNDETDDANHRLPAVVILDLNLPDGSGVEVLAALRARPTAAPAAPPRIAVWTGGAPMSILAQVQSLRPDASFLKPRDVEKLIEWLGEAGSGENAGS